MHSTHKKYEEVLRRRLIYLLDGAETIKQIDGLSVTDRIDSAGFDISYRNIFKIASIDGTEGVWVEVYCGCRRVAVRKPDKDFSLDEIDYELEKMILILTWELMETLLKFENNLLQATPP